MAPGFAFRTCEGGIGYQGLLQDRSAQLITTMDTPPLVHRLLYRQPGKNALARATLGFCGIRPVRSLVFGSVKNASTDQREAWHDPTPWLLSVPMLLGILPSITLSGIPDLEADALASKRTLAVRLGFKNALRIALFFVLLSAAAALVWDVWGLAGGAYTGIAWLVVPHAAVLTWLLYRHVRIDRAPGRIDGLMVASLFYVVWFGLVPFLRLAQQ